MASSVRPRPVLAATLPAVLSCLTLAAAARAAADVLIADFEGNDYGGWKVEGEAFGKAPARGTLPSQQNVHGFLGKGLVNTFLGQDGPRGTLTSPEFAIAHRYINFLIGGGAYEGQTCIDLLVGAEVVRTATGRDNEELRWATWDVAALKGGKARIRIVDDQSGGWGHVNVDHIVLSDKARAKPGGDVAEERRREKADRVTLAEQVKDLGFDGIVFTVRQDGKDGHWYANFSNWSSNPKRYLHSDGGRLCRLDLRIGEAKTILDAPDGGVRDPQVHYDGKKMLFSYREGGQPFYHLHEINVDGTGLRRITDGPYDDLEPAYLPDGGIIFCSSRCHRMVNCWHVRVAVVHRCDADGRNMRPLSCNIEQDNTPWVLPDGRVIYQRWEYIDRSQVRFHHLWTMNPDGTGQMVYFGNMHGSTVMIDAKPIPGTQKVVASFSPGHGKSEHSGIITIVDPGNGPDDRRMARAVTPGRHYRDPYPLSEDLFLAAEGTKIFLVDGKGRATQVYDLPPEWRRNNMKVQEPRPIRPRPREQLVPNRVDLSRTTGDVFLTDVYIGRNMKGVERGDIKKLLILEALPKPVNFTGGWEPMSFGGTFTLARVIGTVPVEEDGSAFMKLPALRSLFFVALDEDDMSVKRMQSFLTVQPGESVSCVGCHETRGMPPPRVRRPLAGLRPASDIEPVPDIPYVFDFPRDIQPILDRHCVGCHDYDKTAKGGPRSGGVILAGDRGGIYSHSYCALTLHKQISDGRNADGNRAPRTIGSSASPILQKLGGDHNKVELSAHEKKMVRLWIETGAPYPGTYAALGTGMIGATDVASPREYRRAWDGKVQDVIKRRCAECHKAPKTIPRSADAYTFGFGGGHIDGNLVRYRFDPNVVYNLTRPEKSLVLLVPLAKDAGGWATLTDKARAKEEWRKKDWRKGHLVVFRDASDPDYRLFLGAIRATKEHLDRYKRFDMPGFRPNQHYVREMKSYGVLPEGVSESDPIDVYETDRRYWESFWHRPKRNGR